MKQYLSILVLSLLAWSALAQGTLVFFNRIPGVVNARVFYRANESEVVPADSRFVAQLYASTSPDGPMIAVGAPVPFLQTPEVAQGYWMEEIRIIPGVPEFGTVASIQVRAWATEVGTSYEEALVSGRMGLGQSAILRDFKTGSAADPAPLEGLGSFEILTILPVPEPSIAVLAWLGAGLLSLRRKRTRGNCPRPDRTP